MKGIIQMTSCSMTGFIRTQSGDRQHIREVQSMRPAFKIPSVACACLTLMRVVMIKFKFHSGSHETGNYIQTTDKMLDNACRQISCLSSRDTP
jgi:hypothetical protein